MSLRNEMLQVGNELFAAIATSGDLVPLVSAWRDLATRVGQAKEAGELQLGDAQIASTVAARIKSVTTSLIHLGTQGEIAVEELSAQLHGVLINGDDSPEPSPKPPLRTSKRSCRPATRHPASRSPSPPPPAQSGATTHDPRSLPLRHWFLDHLAFPYPSPAEKIAIAAECGVTRQKVDSDLTNWRRRSGWTDMMVRFSGGDRDLMATMINQLLEGRGERVRGVSVALEGVRRYLAGEGPKVEVGWIEKTTSDTPPPIPNPRKRQSTTPEEELLSDDSEVYIPRPTHSRSFQPMPHIPSISSLSTTSTFVNPTDGNSKRTVSGSSRYSYATDSTIADAEAEELVPKAERQHSNPPPPAPTSQPQSVFTFTPLYASPYGLAPATSTSQMTRKRPADAPLESGRTVRRLDPAYYPSHPYPQHAGPSHQQHSYTPVRALSSASSHSSAGETESSSSSPSNVADIEANYLPYASFGGSGQILQAQAEGSGGVPRSTPGSGSGEAGLGGMGQMGSDQMGSGQMEMSVWSVAPPPGGRPEWAREGGFRLPQGDYEFAPRLEGWVG